MKSSKPRGLGALQPEPAEAGGWLRARRPEHKQERRDTILAAARQLLDREGVEGATLSAIAREAELSKANCYRYFESREAILLAVILDDARGWVREIDGELAPLAGRSDVAAVAEIFVRTTVARPRVCMLMSALWSVLERNVGAESIADFKRSFLQVSAAPIASLGRALPSLSPEDVHAFVTFFFLFVAGSWSAANPAPVVAEVLQREEFAGQCIHFELVLRAHTETMLTGLLAKHG